MCGYLLLHVVNLPVQPPIGHITTHVHTISLHTYMKLQTVS